MPTRAPGQWVDLPWFLTTSPVQVPDRVLRPRLDALLESHVARHPVTLVVAPAGFGKTSAVAQWARTRPATVWATTVAGVDSLQLVRGALLQALPQAVGMRLRTLATGQEAPGWGELVARIARPTTVVVDDAHLLDPTVLHETLLSEPLLLSGAVRVVLVGQPVLSRVHSRVVAAGLAGVVGAHELAFTCEETRTLLEREGGDGRRAEALVERTGGWAVAVRLLALAGPESDLPVPVPADDEAHVPGAGGPRDVLDDYVEHSVLAALDDDLAQFVLEATTCNRLDVALTTALTGRPDSGALLDACVTTGLFLDRFGAPGAEQVYRWHECFAQAVQRILERRDPQRSARLHRRASRALAPHFPTEAVQHALAAGEPGAAAGVVADSWLGMLFESQARTLDQLCLQLPSPYRESAPTLTIRACCAGSLGETDVAASLAERARNAAQQDGQDPDAEFVLRFGELLLVDEPAAKAAAADVCWELLPGVNARQHTHALYALAWVELRLRRDLARAVDQLGAVVRVAEAEGRHHLAAAARANLGFALSASGRFRQAEEVLGDDPDADSAPGWESFDGGLRSFSRGFADFWRGDLVAAERQFAALVANTEDRNSFYPLGRVYFALTVSVLRRESAYAEAEFHLGLVPNVPRHAVPWEAYKRLAAGWLQAVRGRREQALALTTPLLEHAGVPAVHALAAELHRQLDDRPGAARLLAVAAEGPRIPYVQCELLTTTALLSASRGDVEEAHRYLERALDVAREEGTCRAFVGDDPLLADLLAEHPRYGTRHEELLVEVKLRRGRVRASGLPVLTARERELLGYLRTSMTTQEIADELHLSLNTVKTHFRSIYRKLGVNNRRSAAKVLGS